MSPDSTLPGPSAPFPLPIGHRGRIHRGWPFQLSHGNGRRRLKACERQTFARAGDELGGAPVLGIAPGIDRGGHAHIIACCREVVCPLLHTRGLHRNDRDWLAHLLHAMMRRSKMPPKPPVRTATEPFDVHAFLDSAGVSKRIVRFARDAVVFTQGAQANNVFYIQDGGVKLSVLSSAGKEAVVAILGPGDFFGEGCLAGQPLRMGTATAVVPSRVLRIPKREMLRTLHREPEFSDRFIAHMLARNIRIEEDLVDQLFNSSEKRLARTLLLLARYGKEDTPQRTLPKLSQETLAEMVGTTRSRVNFFMNKFRKLGFIEYNGGLTINSSLLSIVLHD